MNPNEIKTSLHRLIDSVQDNAILQAVHTILTRQAESEADFWADLSDAQRADIEAGLADLEAGRKKDFKDVMRKYQ